MKNINMRYGGPIVSDVAEAVENAIKETGDIEHTITYTSKGKSLTLLKRDERWMGSMLDKMARMLSGENTGYQYHPLYWQLRELEDKIKALVELKGKEGR